MDHTMNVRSMVSKAPNWLLVVCGTIVLVVVISAITLLSFAGKSSDDLIRLLNTVMNVASTLLAGGAFVAAGAAASTARNVEQKQADVASNLAEAIRKDS
jgi:type IV secretory pathway TrbL component